MSIVLTILLIPSSVKSENLDKLMSEANRAWTLEQYSKSQAIFTRITEAYSLNAKKGLFGAKFGIIYYRKGLTELKLAAESRRHGDEIEAQKWFALAKESFQICYEDFPNQEK